MLMRSNPIARQSSASGSFWNGFIHAFAAPMLFWCSFRSIAESSPSPDMKSAWAEVGKAMQTAIQTERLRLLQIHAAGNG